MKTHPKPLPLESFYPQLAEHGEVKEEIKKLFGKDTDRILGAMIAGTLTEEENTEIDAPLRDLVNNGWEEETFYGQGSDGYFPISVRGIESVYYIQASEFDDIGYFASAQDARAYAEIEYESYSPFVDDPDEENQDYEDEDDGEEE
jgi:hypothetical protein